MDNESNNKVFAIQKERVEKGEIAAATLKNFIKSLKIFCDSADIDIPWKKVTRGLPKGRQAASDRAPTIEEIRKLVGYPDRSLNLTSTDMLKGYLLSHIDTQERKNDLNELWKKRIAELKAIANDEDLEFFKAWLRAKYVETIRPSKKGAENEDFENIARFHSWVKENTKKIMLQNKETDYYKFVKQNFDYYSELCSGINDMSIKMEPGLEQIYYIMKAGFAPSFYFPLLMAPVELSDDKITKSKKMALVARFIESFLVLRSVNNRTLAHASIRYTMYNLIKEIRGQELERLADMLKKKILSFEEKFDGMMDFRLHHKNKRFVHFLLARITDYIECQSGYPSKFEYYVNDRTTRSGTSKPFEIEHIWSDKFDDHRDEFSQREDFEEYRNLLGALILLPKGINQSYGADSYQKKLNYYCRENLLAQSVSTML